MSSADAPLRGACTAEGFCGIVSSAAGVSITPRLPARWQKVVVPYKYGKNSYEIVVEKAGVQVRVLEQNGPHPEFLVNGSSAQPVR